jgi:hypothetical protein
MFETSGLDFRVQVSPFNHLVPSRTCESVREHPLFPQNDGGTHPCIRLVVRGFPRKRLSWYGIVRTWQWQIERRSMHNSRYQLQQLVGGSVSKKVATLTDDYVPRRPNIS